MSKKRPARAAAAPKEAPYEPASGERDLVMLGVCVDADEAAIMSLVGKGKLTVPQFKAAFATELAHGKEIAKIKVMSSLYLMAMSRARGLAPTSAIAIMNNVGGWAKQGGSASVKVKDVGENADGSAGIGRTIEVEFVIGDDSKIKDEG